MSAAGAAKKRIPFRIFRPSRGYPPWSDKTNRYESNPPGRDFPLPGRIQARSPAAGTPNLLLQ
ncbi:MAG: hypothetical protein OXU61_01970 [Gammaproteobacteria bacterium]|nr:hypothetical protein [Gammaproteobacteria bacterium]